MKRGYRSLTLAVLAFLSFSSVGLRAQEQPKYTTKPTSKSAPVVTNTDIRKGTMPSAGPELPPGPPPPLPEALTLRLESYSRSVVPHGVYFEALDGKPVVNINQDTLYNPASVTKVMTSLAVLDQFGVNYRYPTRVSYTGEIDKATGVLKGDLVIEGENDPSFATESVFLIGEKLRSLGVTAVEGNLRVGPGVMVNMTSNPLRAGGEFLAALDSSRWNSRVLSVWNAVQNIKTFNRATPYAGVTVTPGTVVVDDRQGERKPLMTYQSSPLIKILKGINAYSNNEMTHVVGARVGGAQGVQQYLYRKVGLLPGEVTLQTTSGLGGNAVTPRAVTKIMRYAMTWLAKQKLGLNDMLPIAGVDNGTLQRRFTSPDLVGSVIGKTGTLSSTSALAGILYTKDRGPLFFAILERGNPHALRPLQEEIIWMVAKDCGGALSVALGSEMSPSLCEEAVVAVVRQ